MKRLVMLGLMAVPVLLALACSLTSGIPTEEIRRQAIAILGEEAEEELVRDFIVVTPPPTFTVTPTPSPCLNPVSSGTYTLRVFNDQSGIADNPQFAFGLPDGQNTRWEGDSDAIRYWSYSLPIIISGMITHTLVYTPDDTVTSVDLFVHPDRFVSVDEPGWVRVCTGLWSCSFTSQVGSLMYALSGSGAVQVDGATIELSNGCEYPDTIAQANTPTPTLTPTGTPTATIETGSEPPPTAEPTEAPTEAPTDSATVAPPPPTLAPLPTLPLPSPTVALLPSPTLPPPPSPTAPPPAPPTDPPTTTPPTDTPTPVVLPQVAFTLASYSVGEIGGTSAPITVILDKTWPQTVTVDYITSNGTATDGSDYSASSGTLTFAPGVVSQNFNVPILADSIVEGDETVTLTLSNPANATLGLPNPATLTIVDDDFPTVQFSSATYSVDEFAGTATITVTLNVTPVLAVSVNYATSDGTATAGNDYTATSNVLNINPGQTVSTFTVSINNDFLIEGDETLNLSLSTPVNATLGAPSTAVLTIIDDDVHLYVGSFMTDQVLRYHAITGAPIGGAFASGGGLDGPGGVVFGPDGNLYVSSRLSDEVLRYDGLTGFPFGTGACANPDAFVCAGSGGLDGPVGLSFGSDGNLYVASENTNEVLRYNGTTGVAFGTGVCANPDAFVCAGSGGLNGPRDPIFGPGGDLYVSSSRSDEVLRFDGTTGVPIIGTCSNPSAFVCAGNGGLNLPVFIIFGTDGNLYVSSSRTNEVLRYDGATGTPSGTGACANPAAFVCANSGGLNGPLGLIFGPDGNLYVSSGYNNEVLRYNGTTGVPFGTGVCVNPDAFVCAGSGGLNAPTGLVFRP